MKDIFKNNVSLPFYLFVTGVFLIIISPGFLSEGMFMDGLIYSTLAKNMANGLGTFWNPYFSATFMTEFQGHPPLAFGIQSVFFYLFGESRFIDKLYSLLTVVIVGYLILEIWKILKYKQGWFVLFLWLLTPVVSWACCNNMLENTLTIFTTSSVYFYLRSQKTHMYFVFLSGIMLAMGFLTKGFVAFFPWTFPFLMWFFIRQQGFKKMIFDTIMMFLASVLPLILIIFFLPEAKTFLIRYFNVQVLSSMHEVATVDSRFFLLKKLFSELIPSISLSLAFIFWGWRNRFNFNLIQVNYKKALVFALLAFFGVIPIVIITLKQSGFYILATYPFFALGLGILLNPLVENLCNSINYYSKGYKVFRWTSFVFFFAGIFLCLYFSNHINRDRNTIKDMSLFLPEIPTGSVINIEPVLWQEWGLHGYFARYKNISLDANIKNKRDYLVLKNEHYSDSIKYYYRIVPLITSEYKLLKRK